jgi:hypothetical protein
MRTVWRVLLTAVRMWGGVGLFDPDLELWLESKVEGERS